MSDIWLDREYVVRFRNGYAYRLFEIDEGVWKLQYEEKGRKPESLTFSSDMIPFLVQVLQEILQRAQEAQNKEARP